MYVKPGPPRQPRMPRIGPCQVLAATLTLSQPGGQIMPTLYWGPWLAKICRGGPVLSTVRPRATRALQVHGF